MIVKIHPHAADRLEERGALLGEVIATVETGEKFSAKFGRFGFRRNFEFNNQWRGKSYSTKQVEAYAVEEAGGWLVITVITRFF